MNKDHPTQKQLEENVKKVEDVNCETNVMAMIQMKILQSFIVDQVFEDAMRQWILQLEMHFDFHNVTKDVNHLQMARTFLQGHALEWWTIKKKGRFINLHLTS